MKVRALTLGLSEIPDQARFSRAAKWLHSAAEQIKKVGIEVQTLRIALPHWESGLGTLAPRERARFVRELDVMCEECGIPFCSVGIARDAAHIEHLSTLIAETARISGAADAADSSRGADSLAIRAAARATVFLAHHTPGGMGNFRFGTGFSLPSNIPFFPASFHAGKQDAFSVGFENSDVLNDACQVAGSPTEMPRLLRSALTAPMQAVESACVSLAESTGIKFAGIDTSLAPSLAPSESIVAAFASLGQVFGKVGTLATCALITDVLKSIEVKRVGYCGLMLPVLEDNGLSRSADEQAFDIGDLIRFSSVCAVGVDMVPLAGDVSDQHLIDLMRDVAALSIKLAKPLCVRVLPIVGKNVGELTDFTSPLLCNCRILAL